MCERRGALSISSHHHSSAAKYLQVSKSYPSPNLCGATGKRPEITGVLNPGAATGLMPGGPGEQNRLCPSWWEA